LEGQIRLAKEKLKGKEIAYKSLEVEHILLKKKHNNQDRILQSVTNERDQLKHIVKVKQIYSSFVIWLEFFS
jgi:hypothetical protein